MGTTLSPLSSRSATVLGGVVRMSFDSLPQQTVDKVIKEALAKRNMEHILCKKEARILLNTCCFEFLELLGSQSYEACEKEKRTTIQPRHVHSAMEELGFHALADESKTLLKEQKEINKSRKAKKAGRSNTMSEADKEEAIRKQRALLAAAKAQATSTPLTPTAASLLPSPTASTTVAPTTASTTASTAASTAASTTATTASTTASITASTSTSG